MKTPGHLDEDEREALLRRTILKSPHLVLVDHGADCKQGHRVEALHRDLAAKRGLTVTYDPHKG